MFDRMSVALRHPMTVAEFLAWEERQELRWEFDGVRPVTMPDTTFARGGIDVNIMVAIQKRLAGGAFRAFGPGMKIAAGGSIRYPDADVAHGGVSAKTTVIPDPIVVFEVLTESTSRTARIEKLREYRANPSIQRYVILEQDVIAAVVFRREGNDFVAETLTDADTLRMPEIGIDVPVAEFYADIDLPDETV